MCMFVYVFVRFCMRVWLRIYVYKETSINTYIYTYISVLPELIFACVRRKQVITSRGNRLLAAIGSNEAVLSGGKDFGTPTSLPGLCRSWVL